MKYFTIILIIIITYFPVYGKSINSYSNYKWKNNNILKNAKLPNIQNKKQFSKFKNIVYAKNKVFWVINDKKQFGLFQWDIKTNQTKKQFFLNKRIRGFAYCKKNNKLLIRTKKHLLFYNPSTLNLTTKKNFRKTKYTWTQILCTQNQVIEYNKEKQSLDYFNLNSIERTKSVKLPKSKLQRMIVYDKNHILLFSSYWGNKLYLYNINTNKIESTTVATLYHYHGLFSATPIGNKLLGSFDIYKNKIAVLKKIQNIWVDLYKGQKLQNNMAYRSYPIKHNIKATVKIKAKSNLSATEIYLVIPPKKTYVQELSHEVIFNRKSLIHDKIGNRFLKLKIPALKKGTTYKRTFYQAKLTRYKAVFDLSKITRFNKNKMPKQFNIYLKNTHIYQINHPKVNSVFQKEFGNITQANKLIESVYQFAVHKIKGKWDGKSDIVPKILENLHGGCNEHSRVQVALLRHAGIPVRFNWNHFGKKDMKLTFNHKFAEVWLPQIGWFPLEPLGSPRIQAGELSTYNFIFSVRAEIFNKYILKRDRLSAYAGKKSWKKWRIAPIKVEWKLSK